MGVVVSIPTGSTGIIAMAMAATAAVPAAAAGFHHPADINMAAAPSAMVGSGSSFNHGPVVNMQAADIDSSFHVASGSGGASSLHDSNFAKPYLKS